MDSQGIHSTDSVKAVAPPHKLKPQLIGTLRKLYPPSLLKVAFAEPLLITADPQHTTPNIGYGADNTYTCIGGPPLNRCVNNELRHVWAPMLVHSAAKQIGGENIVNIPLDVEKARIEFDTLPNSSIAKASIDNLFDLCRDDPSRGKLELLQTLATAQIGSMIRKAPDFEIQLRRGCPELYQFYKQFETLVQTKATELPEPDFKNNLSLAEVQQPEATRSIAKSTAAITGNSVQTFTSAAAGVGPTTNTPPLTTANTSTPVVPSLMGADQTQQSVFAQAYARLPEDLRFAFQNAGLVFVLEGKSAYTVTNRPPKCAILKDYQLKEDKGALFANRKAVPRLEMLEPIIVGEAMAALTSTQIPSYDKDFKAALAEMGKPFKNPLNGLRTNPGTGNTHQEKLCYVLGALYASNQDSTDDTRKWKRHLLLYDKCKELVIQAYGQGAAVAANPVPTAITVADNSQAAPANAQAPATNGGSDLSALSAIATAALARANAGQAPNGMTSPDTPEPPPASSSTNAAEGDISAAGDRAFRINEEKLTQPQVEYFRHMNNIVQRLGLTTQEFDYQFKCGLAAVTAGSTNIMARLLEDYSKIHPDKADIKSFAETKYTSRGFNRAFKPEEINKRYTQMEGWIPLSISGDFDREEIKGLLQAQTRKTFGIKLPESLSLIGASLRPVQVRAWKPVLEAMDQHGIPSRDYLCLMLKERKKFYQSPDGGSPITPEVLRRMGMPNTASPAAQDAFLPLLTSGEKAWEEFDAPLPAPEVAGLTFHMPSLLHYIHGGIMSAVYWTASERSPPLEPDDVQYIVSELKAMDALLPKLKEKQRAAASPPPANDVTPQGKAVAEPVPEIISLPTDGIRTPGVVISLKDLGADQLPPASGISANGTPLAVAAAAIAAGTPDNDPAQQMGPIPDAPVLDGPSLLSPEELERRGKLAYKTMLAQVALAAERYAADAHHRGYHDFRCDLQLKGRHAKIRLLFRNDEGEFMTVPDAGRDVLPVIDIQRPIPNGYSFLGVLPTLYEASQLRLAVNHAVLKDEEFSPLYSFQLENGKRREIKDRDLIPAELFNPDTREWTIEKMNNMYKLHAKCTVRKWEEPVDLTLNLFIKGDPVDAARDAEIAKIAQARAEELLERLTAKHPDYIDWCKIPGKQRPKTCPNPPCNYFRHDIEDILLKQLKESKAAAFEPSALEHKIDFSSRIALIATDAVINHTYLKQTDPIYAAQASEAEAAMPKSLQAADSPGEDETKSGRHGWRREGSSSPVVQAAYKSIPQDEALVEARASVPRIVEETDAWKEALEDTGLYRDRGLPIHIPSLEPNALNKLPAAQQVGLGGLALVPKGPNGTYHFEATLHVYDGSTKKKREEVQGTRVATVDIDTCIADKKHKDIALQRAEEILYGNKNLTGLSDTLPQYFAQRPQAVWMLEPRQRGAEKKVLHASFEQDVRDLAQHDDRLRDSLAVYRQRIENGLPGNEKNRTLVVTHSTESGLHLIDARIVERPPAGESVALESLPPAQDEKGRPLQVVFQAKNAKDADTVERFARGDMDHERIKRLLRNDTIRYEHDLCVQATPAPPKNGKILVIFSVMRGRRDGVLEQQLDANGKPICAFIEIPEARKDELLPLIFKDGGLRDRVNMDFDLMAWLHYSSVVPSDPEQPDKKLDLSKLTGNEMQELKTARQEPNAATAKFLKLNYPDVKPNELVEWLKRDILSNRSRISELANVTVITEGSHRNEHGGGGHRNGRGSRHGAPEFLPEGMFDQARNLSPEPDIVIESAHPPKHLRERI